MIQPRNENNEVKIQLFSKQWDAFVCPKRFVLCSAGIQGGKCVGKETKVSGKRIDSFGFEKGTAQMYRVGDSLRATSEHSLLSPDGWISVSSSKNEGLPLFFVCPLLSSGELSLKDFLLGDQSSWKTVSDFQSDYLEYFRLHGGRPQFLKEVDQDGFPLSIGEVAHTYSNQYDKEYNHVYRSSNLPSTSDDCYPVIHTYDVVDPEPLLSSEQSLPNIRVYDLSVLPKELKTKVLSGVDCSKLASSCVYLIMWPKTSVYSIAVSVNVSIKEDKVDTYWDTSIPLIHAYEAGGFINHNTFVGAVWLLNKIQKYPNDSHLICAPTYKILQQSTLPKFRELVPSTVAKFHEQDSVFDIVGGTGKIYVRSAEDPDTLEGMTLRSAWLDEAGNMKKRVWVIIQGRTSILQGQVFMTTSPYTMNWLYHEVYKPGEDEHKDFGLFQWMSIQNPKFPKEEYQRASTTMNATDFARRYKGLWRKREGLVYQQWNPLTMTFDGSSPVPIKEVVAGVDWGYQHPAAIAVIGIADTPSHVVLDEWYKTKQTIQLMVAAAKELKERWNIRWFYADSARPEYIAEFNKNGLPCLPGNKEIIPGINELRLRIETGNLIVSKSCKNTLEELEMYAYPEEMDSEEPIKQFDHLMDAIRYPIYTYRVSAPVYGADLSPFWKDVKDDIQNQNEGRDKENDEQWFDIGEIEM